MLDPISQQDLLSDIVMQYLSGAEISSIRAHLIAASSEKKQDARALYNDRPASLAIRTTLYSLLRVPEEQQLSYPEDLKLLTLLSRLNIDGHDYDHLAYLLGLIDETTYKRSWRNELIVGALLSVGLAGLFYLKPDYFYRLQDLITVILPRVVLAWLEKTFSLLRNIPLIGIVYTSSSLIWQTIQMLYYGVSHASQTWTAFAFKAASIIASLAGYVVCLLAAGVANPVTSMLFITSSIIDVAESFFTFYMINQRPSPNEDFPEQVMRYQAQQQRATHTLWVKLTAATLITAAVTIWCVCPPSLLIILSCMASIHLVGFIKWAIVEQIDKKACISLQKSLKTVYTPEAKPHVNPSISISSNPLITLGLFSAQSAGPGIELNQGPVPGAFALI